MGKRKINKLLDSFITKVSTAVLMEVSDHIYMRFKYIGLCDIYKSESVVNYVVSITSAPVLKGFTVCGIHTVLSAEGL